MTRVTENMLFSSLQDGISRAQNAVARRTREVQTGRKVDRPSDNPAAAGRSLVFEASLRQLTAMGTVADRAEVELAGSATALTQGSSILQRVMEIAVVGGTESYSAADRQVMATEVEGLRQALVAAGNAKIGDTYVFGGLQTATEPFLPDGTFVGDANARAVEVAPGEQVAMSGSGANAFTAAGGVDVMALLNDLRTDLLANDVVAIRGRIGTVSQAEEQVRLEQVQVGFAQQRLLSATTERTALSKALETSRQKATDVDAATSYVNLTQAQQALEASISAAKQIMAALEKTSTL